MAQLLPLLFFHISSSGGLIIPDGTTAQRSSTATRGEVRFNTSLSTYEGYDGSNWGSLGGVIDVDQDTYVTAETSAGADNDEIRFTTKGTTGWIMGVSGSLTGSVSSHLSASSASTGSFGGVYSAGVSRFVGKVGIGTDNPEEDLDVSSGNIIINTANKYIYFGDSNWGITRNDSNSGTKLGVSANVLEFKAGSGTTQGWSMERSRWYFAC